MYEDSMINVMEGAIGVARSGEPLLWHEVPLQVEPSDEHAIAFAMHLLKTLDGGFYAALCNIDDLASWSLFIGVGGGGMKYQPITSAGGITLDGVMAWLEARDVPFTAATAHYFLIDSLWWLLYAARVVNGIMLAVAGDEEEE